MRYLTHFRNNKWPQSNLKWFVHLGEFGLLVELMRIDFSTNRKKLLNQTLYHLDELDSLWLISKTFPKTK